MKKRLSIFIVLLCYCSIVLLFASPVWAVSPGEPGCTYTGPAKPGDPPAGTPCQDDWETVLGCGGRSRGCQACDWCAEWGFAPEREYNEAAGDPGMNLTKFTIENYKNWGLTLKAGSVGTSGEGGAVGMVNSLIASLYTTQPASSVEYLADVGRNLGLAPPAYAQGLGWTALSPVLGLWKTFRDVAYLAFVVVFVVIGFMIMFRARIDPQTVIGVQNALPRIIVTLLLITFSYAIAGFLIDLMSLSIALILKLIVPTMTPENQQELLGADIFSLVHPIGTGCVDKISQAIGELEFWRRAGIAGEALRFIGWITVTVVFAIAAFFIMFKIFFMLLGSYIGIILAVIFAPILLLLGALPGQTQPAGWLKGLIADILVFPATFVMLLLAAIFQALAGYDTGMWKIPGEIETKMEIPQWAPPLIGKGWGEVIVALISFGILFTIPAVGAAIKQAFAIKPTPLAGRALEEVRARLGWVPFVGGTLERAGI